MSYQDDLKMNEWEFLIGYPLEEAKSVLLDEGAEFVLTKTSAPGKTFVLEEAYVIAVRQNEPLEIICSSPDWTVGGTHDQKSKT